MLFLVFAVLPGFAADVAVPAIELLTWGAMDELGDRFVLQTAGEMQVRVDGENEISAQAVLGFTAVDLEPSPLALESVRLTWAGLFDRKAALTLFYGEGDTLCADTLRAGNLYNGYLSEGIHTLAGTGLQFDLAPHPQRLRWSWYLYQDAQVFGVDPFTAESGHYSTDIRGLLIFPHLRLESFLGATFPAPEASLGWYRGGLMFHAAEAGVEFFAQIGVPRWSPAEESLDIRLLYLLFEPRVRLGKVGFIPTFFWHPAWYRQSPTGEQAFELNLNLLIGEWPGTPPTDASEGAPDTAGTHVSGGIETNLSYIMEEGGLTTSEVQVAVSPYLRFRNPGLTLDFRLNAHLLPFVMEEMIELFMGARVGL